MCISAGLKNREVDEMTVADCLMHILAHARNEREEWKRTSMLAFNIGRFGNSDPKKFPASIKKYMPELWDDVEDSDINNDPLIRAARARRQKTENG